MQGLIAALVDVPMGTNSADNPQRAKLVATLWEIKQRFAKTKDPDLRYIHFNLLLSDPAYRDEIIGKAEGSSLMALQALGRRARQLNVDGELLMGAAPSNEINRQTRPPVQHTPSRAIPAAEAPLTAVPPRSSFPVLSFVLGLLVLLMVAGGGYYVYQQHPEVLGLSREQRVSGSLLQSQLWEADTTYYLESLVFVEGGAQLTIEPGTRILGEPGSALVVTRDATLHARGTVNAPIVFTSAQPEGSRERGDWGGVVLLGNAPVNVDNARIEGLDAQDSRGHFGGIDTTDNCGVVEYVRIEFAGFEAFANNELNGLTLGGCGSNTIVRNVQVHKALDDGVEAFGGTVNLQNVLITGAGDDSLDWDMGWQGLVQFLIIQQHADVGDNGFEADNNGDAHNATPRSRPMIYNATLLGSGSPDQAQRGMTIRRGTGGEIRNAIIANFSLEAIDIRDAATANLLNIGDLVFENILIYNVLDDQAFAAEVGDQDDDGGFDEALWFSDPARPIQINVDPLLPTSALSPTQPNFVPSAQSPARIGAATPPQGEFWDEGANYLGAIRPGVTTSWVDGWTAFPVD